MSATDKLLARLHGVKANGERRWMAACPAHEDRSPSLSIREEGDRVLLHCHAGCSASDVVAAVGLELRDLFDRPLEHHLPPVRSPMRHGLNPMEMLMSIQHEALVVVIVAERLAQGKPLTDPDYRRLIRAANAIQSAVARTAQPEPPEMKRIRRGESR